MHGTIHNVLHKNKKNILYFILKLHKNIESREKLKKGEFKRKKLMGKKQFDFR